MSERNFPESNTQFPSFDSKQWRETLTSEFEAGSCCAFGE